MWVSLYVFVVYEVMMYLQVYFSHPALSKGSSSFTCEAMSESSPRANIRWFTNQNFRTCFSGLTMNSVCHFLA